MDQYKQAKIYKIYPKDQPEICYIGSTIESLNKRYSNHRYHYKCYLNNNYNFVTVFKIFDEYSVDNCKIELLENYPCKHKKELHKREAYYIRNLNCVNKYIPARTKKEYKQENKDKIKNYHKEYSQKNKDKKKKYQSTKITCLCGVDVTKGCFARHLHTNKHQENLYKIFDIDYPIYIFFRDYL